LKQCSKLTGVADKTVINAIEIMQKKALKAVFKLPIHFSTARLFSDYCPTILTVTKMYEYSVCKFVFQL